VPEDGFQVVDAQPAVQGQTHNQLQDRRKVGSPDPATGKRPPVYVREDAPWSAVRNAAHAKAFVRSDRFREKLSVERNRPTLLRNDCCAGYEATIRSFAMTITITAFERSPDRGRGLARDMRVRWALEEVGQAYDVRLVSFNAMKEPAHRALNPFGQIPTYEEGDLVLFESGAIIFHIAERHAGLLPDDANARARAIAWMFAALNTVEPPIVDRGICTLLERDRAWYGERLPILEERIRSRLDELSNRLGGAEWLDGAFSAGDLLMVTVLRRLDRSGVLEEYPSLSAYIARGEARPAYKRAFADQLAVFTGSKPTG
jgi:glutathione S-transferase